MTKTNEQNRKSLPKKKKVRIDYEYKENERYQGCIVYQIPAEEIVKLREADFEELNIHWIEKWCYRLKKENGGVQRW